MPNYNEIVIEFREEIDRLMRIRENTERQIRQLTDAVKAIQSIAEGADQPIITAPELPFDEEIGFTERVRTILKRSPAQAFLAVDIRDLLVAADPDLDPKIALIHTHNTLKRLIRQGEISEIQMPEGKTGYRFKLKPVVDLMAALKQSLADMEGKKTASRNALSRVLTQTQETEEESKKKK